MKTLFLVICLTNWICTNGGGKTFIIPYSTINQGHYYTEHHIDFGDGSDTAFFGIYNPIALAYQTIKHTYNPGIHIATLTTSFYDSTTQALLCQSSKQDTICSPIATFICEIKKSIKNKIYNLQGIELKKEPLNQIYFKNNKGYYKL
tara:strand:+ start:310 stop:750 length:441 start_codon:yes stop_codon:yes gene_type:complete